MKLLSDLIVWDKYARYIPELQRRETWDEIVNRTMKFFREVNDNRKALGFKGYCDEDMKAIDTYIREKKVLPSLRLLQYAGEATHRNHARAYNCCAVNLDCFESFSEALFLLLSGCGVGYSVRKEVVNKLPAKKSDTENIPFNYPIRDSIEGWADALYMLLDFGMKGIPVNFDYSEIRPKGSPLVTSGGTAPGPEPLKKALDSIANIITHVKVGEKLTSFQVHEILCFAAMAVQAGGSRRSAMICFFDHDDIEMMGCKTGDWWQDRPHLAASNNSVILDYATTEKETFLKIMQFAESCGEPGVAWRHNVNILGNPCVSGDTEILTRQGYRRIDSLLTAPVEIWNGFEWSEVQPKITGRNQEMVTVTFSDGRTLRCTLYHKFHIAVGYRGETKIVEAKDLQPGDKLIKHKLPVLVEGDQVDARFAYTQGFKSADGMDGYKYLSVYEPKYMCLQRLAGTVKGGGKNNVRFSYDNEHLPKSFVPFSWDLDGKLNWLAGLFDGDGCELKEGGLQLVSVDRTFLSDLQKLLSTLGIQSKIVSGMKAGYRLMPDGHGGSKDYLCQESYRICVGAIQMRELKRLGLKCERLHFNKQPQRDASQFVSIVDVTESGTEKFVYCFNEPKNHTGIFNGVITGQCFEISLKPNQFCNLSTINFSSVVDNNDLDLRAMVVAMIGTLQATLTDFTYLRPIWKETTEADALIGGSMTGLARKDIDRFDFDRVANLVKICNVICAERLGINKAARCTAIKPEGSSSLVLGSSSGVHAWYDKFYIRRVTLNKHQYLYQYLNTVMPSLIEDKITNLDEAFICIPVKAPEGAITRHDESMNDLYDRVIKLNTEWVKGGHREGEPNNVSATINVKPDEYKGLFERMWEDRYKYSGLSVFPHFDGAIPQSPFESITEEQYNEMCKHLVDIDFTQITEYSDDTNLSDNMGCSSGQCDLV